MFIITEIHCRASAQSFATFAKYFCYNKHIISNTKTYDAIDT